MSLLAAVPDHVLKERTDPEAHDELVRRGLRFDRRALIKAAQDHQRHARQHANRRGR